MAEKVCISMKDVFRAGEIISTEYDYDLQYSPEEERFVPFSDGEYLLGVVDDSLLLRKAEEFIELSRSTELKSKCKFPLDSDGFFDFLKLLGKAGLKKGWNNFISPFKREVGLEWAAASGLDAKINLHLDSGPIAPEIPEIPCRKCGTLCESAADTSNIPSEVGGIRLYPVLSVCPSCGNRSLMRVLNDGYEVGLHHQGDQHPFWSYSEYDRLLHNLHPGSPAEDELRFVFEEYHMRVHDTSRLKKILGRFKGRRKSHSDPDYVKALCVANVVGAMESKPSELKSLSGDGLTDLFAAAYVAVKEDATGYQSEPGAVLRELDRHLADSGSWYRYFFTINYLLNYRCAKAGDENPLGWPYEEYKSLMLGLAREVADPACHDTFLKSLFCDLFENMCSENMPVRDEVLRECGELFCRATKYRAISAVVGFKLGLYDVMKGDFESGTEHLKHVMALMEEEKDSGPFTSIRVILSCMLVAAIEKDAARAGLATKLIGVLDRSIPMRSEEKLELMVPIIIMTDMENRCIKSLTSEEIVGMAEGLSTFPLHEYT